MPEDVYVRPQRYQVLLQEPGPRPVLPALLQKNDRDMQKVRVQQTFFVQFDVHRLTANASYGVTKVFRLLNGTGLNGTTAAPKLLRINAGERWCVGFVATVFQAALPRVVMVTTARCLFGFSVTCDTRNNLTGGRQTSRDKNFCFDKKPLKRVASVLKGFKSHAMT